jgi:hypothetical protein
MEFLVEGHLVGHIRGAQLREAAGKVDPQNDDGI